MGNTLIVAFPALVAILSLLTGCGTVEPVSEGDVIAVDNDIDGNGVPDAEQSFVVGNDESGNVLVIIDPAQKSPLGSSTGQHPMFWGYGSGEYSSDEDFVPFFPAVEAYNATGDFIGYGNTGFRCGAVYEMSMAESEVELGELDLWWLLGEGVSASKDVTAYLVEHLDGVANGCDRRSVHLAMRVWDDCSVEPLGYSIAPEDPNCYEE